MIALFFAFPIFSIFSTIVTALVPDMERGFLQWNDTFSWIFRAFRRRSDEAPNMKFALTYGRKILRAFIDNFLWNIRRYHCQSFSTRLQIWSPIYVSYGRSCLTSWDMMGYACSWNPWSESHSVFSARKRPHWQSPARAHSDGARWIFLRLRGERRNEKRDLRPTDGRYRNNVRLKFHILVQKKRF